MDENNIGLQKCSKRSAIIESLQYVCDFTERAKGFGECEGLSISDLFMSLLIEGILKCIQQAIKRPSLVIIINIYQINMLTPNLARTLLHRVNLQINSNTICIKDDPSPWNLPEQFKLYRQTNKNIKQLNKDDPTHKISKRNNLLQSFAMLYTKLREAIRDDDQPMLHRYLTNELYQQWKDKNKEAFNLYKTVYNIKLKQAQICQNEHGRWIQCLIRLKHEGEHKEHIVQRKLGLMPDAVRTWYFVRFQN